MTVDILDEDTIKYNRKKYKYNKEMINLLFLGTDTSGSMIQDNEEGADAGQADIAEKRKYLIMIEDFELLATVMNRHLEEKYSQF